MKRRTVLARGLGVAAFTTTLAGCSNDSSGEDDSTDTETTGEGGDSGIDELDGPSSTGESGMPRTVDVSPDSLSQSVKVVAIEEIEASDKRVELDITLQNLADESAPLDHYGVEIFGYTTEEPTADSDAWLRLSTSAEYSRTDQMETPPGETATLRYSIELPSDADATIRSYRVSVDCGAWDPKPPGCE